MDRADRRQPRLQLGGLASDQVIQSRLRDVELFEVMAAGDPDAFFGDSANPVLGITGCAKLSNAHDVQRGAQRLRYFIGNGNATTRQADHHGEVCLINHQNMGQPLSSIMPVGEEHGMGSSYPIPRRWLASIEKPSSSSNSC
jgi:hypothetical protein